MSIFSEQELELLPRSCYGHPRLVEWLERILVEGPGDYDWLQTARGYYSEDERPLFENILVQIEHQGTIYPATFVAVPVLCQLPQYFPGLDHSVLMETLDRLENSRKLHLYEDDISESVLDKYIKAMAQCKENS